MPPTPSTSITAEVDDYNFVETAVEPPPLPFNADAAVAAAAVVPPAVSKDDPLHWDTERFLVWLKRMRPDLDGDIEEAFRYSKVSGQDLLNMIPPDMFRLARKSMRPSSRGKVEVDDATLQATVVQCFKYGRG